MSVMKEVVLLPYRLAQWFSKGILMSLFLVALLLNIVSLTSNATFDRLSGWVEAVVGPRTVRARADAARTAAAAEKAALGAEVAALTAERDELDRRFLEAEAATAAVTGTLAEVRVAGDAALAKAAQLEDELSQEMMVTRDGQTRPAGVEVTATVARVAARLDAASDRAVATASARALPFAGVAATAASTSADLADTCAALSDLAGLAKAFGAVTSAPAEAVCRRTAPSASDLWYALRADPAAAWSGAGTRLALPAFVPDDAYATILRWGVGRFATDPGN